MSSRRSHHAANTPAYAGLPTERLKYAPSMPHCRPMMNTRPQMTSVEETMRIPAWRSASPKKCSTRPEDLADDPPGELRDVAEARDPVARDGKPAAHQRRFASSGLVASSVCVKT